MNPLKTPWGSKPEPEPVLKPKKAVPQYLGLRNERARMAEGAEFTLIIEVRGVGSVPSGPYKVAYSDRAPLRHYLYQLKLLHTASYSAVYDQKYPKKGRLRMTYVPDQDSQILVCPPKIGTATRLQRSSHDASQLAKNMGRRGRGPVPDVVTGVITRQGDSNEREDIQRRRSEVGQI